MKETLSKQSNNLYDVIIIGAGIVGLSAALSLSQQGLRVALVEGTQPKQHLPTTDSAYETKVVAITRASENFFKHMGIWDAIVASRISPYQHMTVWDSVMDGRISFSAVDFFEENLGYIIEQQVIMGALWQALKNQPTVSFFLGETLSQFSYEDRATICLEKGRVLHSYLVIGADGAKSQMRKLWGIDSQFIDYQQAAIVATVQGSLSHYKTAFQRFASDGPLALLPLANPNQSSIVWTTSVENANKLCALQPEAFAKQLTHETAQVMGEMSLRSERFVFPLTSHHAKSYAIDGCVLVGDAAHTLHPLAGLGVNLGLLDVATLAQELKNVKNTSLLGKISLLKRYERQRKMHNQIMIWSMSAFKNGFGTQNVLMQRLRNMSLSWVDKHLSIKQLFAKMALGTIGPIPDLAKKQVQRMSDVKKDSLI